MLLTLDLDLDQLDRVQEYARSMPLRIIHVLYDDSVVVEDRYITIIDCEPAVATWLCLL